MTTTARCVSAGGEGLVRPAAAGTRSTVLMMAVWGGDGEQQGPKQDEQRQEEMQLSQGTSEHARFSRGDTSLRKGKWFMTVGPQ